MANGITASARSMDASIERALDVMPFAINDEMERAMMNLHRNG